MVDKKTDTIKKWYGQLKFPQTYDVQFKRLLDNNTIPEKCTISGYKEIVSEDAGENLLILLFLCEELKQWYKSKGISDDVFLDTMKDIVIWTESYYEETGGELGITETNWLIRHFEGRIFRLGRLQFEMYVAEYDIENSEIKKGDRLLSVHIPKDNAIIYEECEKSFEQSKAFFKKFFPDYNYKYYVCYSWLLDEQLKTALKESSNIIKFQTFFKKVRSDKSDEIIRRVFGKNADRRNIKACSPNSTLGKWIIERVENNGEFYAVYGIKSI